MAKRILPFGARQEPKSHAPAIIIVSFFVLVSGCGRVVAFSHYDSPSRVCFSFSSLPQAQVATTAEGDDTTTHCRHLVSVGNFGITDEVYPRLPDWLKRYEDHSTRQADHAVQCLEYALLEKQFQIADISDIVKDIYGVSRGDQVMMAGITDFLNIFLSLMERELSSGFVCPNVLRASILHYSDCLAARRQGVHARLKRALGEPRKVKVLASQEPDSPDLLACSPCSPGTPCISNRDIEPPVSGVAVALTSIPAPTSATEAQSPVTEIESIADGAARLKRGELLVNAILSQNATTASTTDVRNFLLSLTEDWRSLGIRVVACLYRLEGLIERSRVANEYVERSPNNLQVAREGLRVYAPLAQRLGLHSLKSRIEESAFRILYRRQYAAATTIFRERGEAMRALSSHLLSHLSHTLRENKALMQQLEDLRVVSRVKEPYSFWKKLLRQKLKGAKRLPSADIRQEEMDASAAARSLPVDHVNDGVALRVILKAKQKSPDESEEAIRSREDRLCYHVHNLIRQNWPALEASRVKDYIKKPKPNGYQSLHHTSKITSKSGLEFPFEVQIRSDSMHRSAEFGFAAHWDYKLGAESLPSNTEKSKLGVTSLVAKHGPTLPHSYIEAFVGDQESLRKKQIYVFIIGGDKDHGELVTVPAQSSIKSVVAEIESSISSKVQVWRNGQLACLSDSLDNGDVVMIAL